MPVIIPLLEGLGLITPEISAVIGALAGVFALIHAWRLVRHLLTDDDEQP